MNYAFKMMTFVIVLEIIFLGNVKDTKANKILNCTNCGGLVYEGREITDEEVCDKVNNYPKIHVNNITDWYDEEDKRNLDCSKFEFSKTKSKHVTNSSNIDNKSKLNVEEIIAIVEASEVHAMPDNVFSMGMSIGLLRFCPSVSENFYQVQKQKAYNWVLLGSTEFEELNGETGFLNNRKLDKLKTIYKNGIKKGLKDGKLIQSSNEFKRNICKEILSDKYLNGPSEKLMKLVP